jgi:hypothetical protein
LLQDLPAFLVQVYAGKFLAHSQQNLFFSIFRLGIVAGDGLSDPRRGKRACLTALGSWPRLKVSVGRLAKPSLTCGSGSLPAATDSSDMDSLRALIASSEWSFFNASCSASARVRPEAEILQLTASISKAAAVTRNSAFMAWYWYIVFSTTPQVTNL